MNFLHDLEVGIGGLLLFKCIRVMTGNRVRIAGCPVCKFLVLVGEGVRCHRRLLRLLSTKVGGQHLISSSHPHHKERLAHRSNLVTNLENHLQGLVMLLRVLRGEIILQRAELRVSEAVPSSIRSAITPKKPSCLSSHPLCQTGRSFRYPVR